MIVELETREIAAAVGQAKYFVAELELVVGFVNLQVRVDQLRQMAGKRSCSFEVAVVEREVELQERVLFAEFELGLTMGQESSMG